MIKYLVNKPYLINIDEFKASIDKIWKNNWLTNQGPFSLELEKKLKDYLGCEHIVLLSSGTIALMMILYRYLHKNSGEVITTPFSFPATLNSIIWVGGTPVFADINYDNDANCNVDEIIKKITPYTKLILLTHVYGIPCDIERLEEVAERYSIPIIYDACHTFGCKYKDIQLCNYGDAAALSFHATKIFSTIEGGAIICKTKEEEEYYTKLRNFGITGENQLSNVYGINGKLNEVSSAYGIIKLKGVDEEIAKRKKICEWYMQLLPKEHITFFSYESLSEYNYIYLPIKCSHRDYLYDKLKDYNIHARKYFFPLLSNNDDLVNAKRLVETVICLPLYYELEFEDVEYICEKISLILDEI